MAGLRPEPSVCGALMSSRKVRWEEMLPDELLEAVEQCPVCYLAYGLAEPHGAYCALGLDWLKAQALAERAASEFGGVVAPPFAWHVSERPEFDWLGSKGVRQALTSAVPADVFLQVVLYQIRAVDARGFHAAILMTGHYGGPERDMKLLCEYYVRRTGSPLRLCALADWEAIDFEDVRGDHAGLCETSQMMYLRPELVDLRRRESESKSGPWAGRDFPQPDGKMPSAELGEQIVLSQVRTLGIIQAGLLRDYKPKPGWQAPTLQDTADIWARFERLTRKYWECSRTLSEVRSEQQTTFPGWEELGE